MLRETTMTVPILVVETNGQYCASLIGSPELRCVRASRAEAVAALQGELAQKVADRELINLEIPPLGVSGLAGHFQGDAELRAINEQIYRERDTQKLQ